MGMPEVVVRILVLEWFNWMPRGAPNRENSLRKWSKSGSEKSMSVVGRAEE